MSQDVNGFISWLRSWFDDIYALKGSGGNISLDDVYPVGSIYMSANSTSPSTLFGGNWWKLQDRFLLASGTKALGSVGGEETHTLTVDEMPSHRHKVSSGWQDASGTDRLVYGQKTGGYNDMGQGGKSFIENTGGGQAHNNMPPYLTVNMWKRLQQETYYNDGTRTSDLTIGSGVNVTVTNNSLKITTTTTGEKYVSFPLSLTSNDNFIFEFELAQLGTQQNLAVYMKNATTANGFWVGHNTPANTFGGGVGGSTFNVNKAVAVGDKFRLMQENGVISFYQNDDLIYSKSATLTGTYTCGFYTNQNRVQYIKNIKLIPLE